MNTGEGFKIIKASKKETLLTDVVTTNEKVIINYSHQVGKLKVIQVLPNGKFKKSKIGIGIIAFPGSLELFFCDRAGFLNPESEHLIHPTDYFTINIEEYEN